MHIRIAALRRALITSAAMVALLAMPALAQQQAQPTVEAGDIIVTAQRRAERLEAVPMSISVLTPDVLEKTGVNNV